jgi:phosphoribosylformylglycinamidine synthase
MLILPGAPALSPFRLAKLLERLRALDPGVRSVSARFVHLVALDAALDEAQRDTLGRLLTYGPREEASQASAAAGRLLVVPRAGTISPWSSKATDIAHVCGLAAVRRIERGVEYSIDADGALAPPRLQALAPALVDRMTEMALLDPAEAEQLFA